MYATIGRDTSSGWTTTILTFEKGAEVGGVVYRVEAKNGECAIAARRFRADTSPKLLVEVASSLRLVPRAQSAPHFDVVVTIGFRGADGQKHDASAFDPGDDNSERVVHLAALRLLQLAGETALADWLNETIDVSATEKTILVPARQPVEDELKKPISR